MKISRAVCGLIAVALLVMAPAPLRGNSEDVDDHAERSRALGEVDAYLKAHPSRFGGFYVDSSAGGDVVVLVTARVDAHDRTAVRDIVPGSIGVRFVEVENSFAEIDSAHEDINDLLRSHDPRVDGIRGVGVELGDLERGDNVLTVRIEPQRMADVRAFLTDRLGTSLFRFEAGPYDQNATCTSARGACGAGDPPAADPPAAVPSDQFASVVARFVMDGLTFLATLTQALADEVEAS